MPLAKVSQKPRKTPVQARSTFTVESIFSATIQVLIEHGLEKLTTTRVADRAGTSVGTLYQYFPNKSSLLAAVLEQHLKSVVEAIEDACVEVNGRMTHEISDALINAFFDAKLKDRAASKALYSVAGEAGGAEIVNRMTQRSQIAIFDVLTSASDAKYNNVQMISLMLSTVPVGPVQALLAMDSNEPAADAIREHTQMMMRAYLSELN